ncbi:MAG: adenylate/guanylate cyclase domain-containing protein [Chitinophagaceae bacterium]
MEKNIAILIADLSGYTALTETHGSIAAADLIDKYIGIVENSLVGDSKLHERTGDEIMVVSSSPDFLLATALMIGKNTFNEENFLQVHGGLHYGKVLMRANSYFGSAINLTSRIAAKANAGTYWCSEEYVNALSTQSEFILKSKGNHLFKNISKEKQVFELSIEDRKTFFIDPVCRMLILDIQKAIPHASEPGIYFCSPDCLKMYDAH